MRFSYDSPLQMRCTKMPGVWTWSGSSSPTSTISSTSAIVTFAGRRAHRVEVHRRVPVDEVAEAVALPRLHEREVAADRRLEHVRRPSNSRVSFFGESFTTVPSGSVPERVAAVADRRARARRREERRDPGAAGAQPLGQRPLRRELDLELARQVLPLELLVLADVARDHLHDLLVSQQDPEAEVVDAAVVAPTTAWRRAGISRSPTFATSAS
jgi:hypothetical protein